MLVYLTSLAVSGCWVFIDHVHLLFVGGRRSGAYGMPYTTDDLISNVRSLTWGLGFHRYPKKWWHNSCRIAHTQRHITSKRSGKARQCKLVHEKRTAETRCQSESRKLQGGGVPKSELEGGFGGWGAKMARPLCKFWFLRLVTLVWGGKGRRGEVGWPAPNAGSHHVWRGASLARCAAFP